MGDTAKAAAKNTDRELWREREDDFYSPSLFVTEGGGIGVNIGGHCIVKPIRDWFRLIEDNLLMRQELQQIADIAEGSGTVNSLPHIARIARRR